MHCVLRRYFAMFCFDLAVDLRLAVGVGGASCFSVGALQLIVNVVGRRIVLFGDLKMLDRIFGLSVFEQQLA